MSAKELDTLFDRGDLEFEAGRYTEAAATYARILELDPDSGRAQLGYVRALSLNGQNADAFAFLEPKRASIAEPRLLVELGRMLYANQRFATAVDVFQRASEQLPNDGHVLANLGFSLWENGQRPDALRVLQQALPLVEDDTVLSANMGQIFLQLGMWHEAISSYERYLADFPNDLNRRVSLAFCLKNAGWREEAETVLGEVLTVSPDFEPAQQLLEAILADEGETAIGDTPVVAATGGSDAPSLLLDIPADDAPPAFDLAAPEWDLGEVSVVDGLDDSAIRKRVSKELLEKVEPLLQEGDLTGAIALLEKERLSSEAPAEVMNLIGKALIETQDYEAALDAFREAAELDPKHPQAHSNLGVLLWQLGEVDEAIETLRTAIQLDSEDFDALVNLALICHQVGMHDDAVNLYVRYLEQQPEDTDARIELAECYVQLDEINAALQELDTVLLLDPENERAQARYDELSKQSDA